MKSHTARIGAMSIIVAMTQLSCLGSPTPLAPGIAGSVGLPHHGVLTTPNEIPVHGQGYVRYRPHGDRNFGTRTLVSALERAAKRVANEFHDSPPLVIGDLSARSGGRISGHASHRTGRDVDLLYFATTLEQVPILSPGFVHFGADTLARKPDGSYICLDIPRQWALIRALLTDRDVEVLWMFVSRDIEAYLIDYGRSLGESPELLLKAERVLHQPRDSANHDDHLHLRVACTNEESVRGCESGGPNWPWLRSAEVTDDTDALARPEEPVQRN